MAALWCAFSADCIVTPETLRAAVATFGVQLSDAQIAALQRLLDELNEWNRQMNLTAIREPAQQWRKHILDSLSIQPFLRGVRIADIGTGAGFPGLPLALVNADKQFVLIDSVNKKLRFVAHAAGAMGLTNVDVVHTRAEQYKPEPRFDCVLSRAMGSIENFVKWCGHLCTGHGRLLAMKGRYPDEELHAIPSGWKLVAVHAIQVPELDEQRHLVELCRSHEKL